MESGIKACIISAYTPGFSHGVRISGHNGYANGQKRLVNSLIHQGFGWDILVWQDYPNTHYHTDCGYNIKASAFSQARTMGYTHILWLDSSVWAVRDPNKIFDVINHEGYYMWRSGFNCAQVCNDKALEYFKMDRDQAESFQDCSSSMLGLNIDNPKARRFLDSWLNTAKNGMWATSREHDNGSADPRYQFDRQDQSCASLIAGRLKMKLYDPGVYSQYANETGDYPDSVIFVMRGI